MDEIQEAIQAYMGEATTANRDAVVAAMQKNAQPIFQHIHDIGHSAAHKTARVQTKDLEKKLADAQEALTAAETRLTEATANQPDVSKVHDQYKAEIQTLKAAHASALADMKASQVADKRERAKADLVASLVSKGVDKDYAEVQVAKAEGRMRFSEDGSLEILQAGKEIPFAPGDGQTAVGLLAEEIRTATPTKFVSTNADSGSGVGANGGAGAGGGNYYDTIRAQMEERNKAQAANTGTNALAERMGMAPVR